MQLLGRVGASEGSAGAQSSIEGNRGAARWLCFRPCPALLGRTTMGGFGDVRRKGDAVDNSLSMSECVAEGGR